MNALSSLLNFIGNKIADMQSPEVFTITRNSSISAGEGRGIYDKVSKIVRINLYFNNGDTGISTGDTIFTVPAAYRPSETKRGSGIVYSGAASTKLTAGSAFIVDTNGAVKQQQSPSTTRGFGYIEYVLGG